MRKILILILCLACADAVAPAVATAAEPAVVSTPSGQLRGEIADGVRVFKGVPFAAPPIGEGRWRDSLPSPAWRGVREAKAFGPACAQVDVGFNSAIAASSSEDCLYLNVWTPANAKPGSRLPVMIYFHGGANRGGSAIGDTKIDPPHEGGALARNGVVVVTTNYRLGVFGFLAHPQLTTESPHHSSGNYALSDMLTALRWVQTNISAFGGDPGLVTAFGQSAGAWNISALMTSPLARGLMHRAILQSGNIVDAGIVDPGLAEAEQQGRVIAERLDAGGDNAIAALRALPAKEVLAAFARRPGEPSSPPPDINYDGYFLVNFPALAFRDRQVLPIPLIVGSTARDGDRANMGSRGSAKATAAAADLTRPLAGTAVAAALTDAGRANLTRLYDDPELVAQALALYEAPASVGGADRDIEVRTDINFRCGAGALARLHSPAAPSWRYELSHGYEPLGAVHIWDVQYVFGVMSAPADQPRDLALSQSIQRYWTNFAKTGNPNDGVLPAWPQASQGGTWLDFASDGPIARSGAPSAACALFDRRVEQIFQQQDAKTPGR